MPTNTLASPKNGGSRNWTWTVGLLAVFGLLASAPGWADGFRLLGIRDLMLFALFAVSLDLFWGRTGILSFGHATFFGLGAYGMAIANVTLGVDPSYSPLVGLALGLGVSAAVALAVGYFLIFGGVRGAYFTIITLALALIAQHIAIGWSSVTGGDSGLIGVPSLGIAGYSLSEPTAQFYLVWAVLLSVVLGIWAILRGKHGLVLRALQANEVKAQTLGHNTAAYILTTFVVSALIAALAGAIYATGTGFVAPDMLGLLLSTEVVMWVAVGGRASILGPIVGTFAIWHLQQEISSLSAQTWPLFLGGFFILMVFLFPDGIPAMVRRVIQRQRSSSSSARERRA